MKSLQILTAADSELVTVAEIRQHMRLKVVNTDLDTHLALLLKGVRQQAEIYTDRSLGVGQKLRLKLDSPVVRRSIGMQAGDWSDYEAAYFDTYYGYSACKLPRGPVIAITSVRTIDSDGDATTVDSGDYYTDGERIVFTAGLLNRRQFASLVIEYTTGYADLVTDPADADDHVQGTAVDALKIGLMMGVATCYLNPTDWVIGTIVAKLPTSSATYFDSVLQVSV